MGPIALTFEVSKALPAEVTGGLPTYIAAWLFLPDDQATLGPKPVTMALLAGGSYDKRYYHVEVPGREGYSCGEYLAAKGNVVLALDHLGVGESTRVPDQKRAVRAIVAAAMHAAVEQFYGQIRSGTLHASLPTLEDFVRIGGGHSMGAMMTVIQQANHASYDAIMVLGYTADGVHITMNGSKLCAATLIPQSEGPDYSVADRGPMHENFHWPDVPADVIAVDDTLSVETPSRIGIVSIETGIIREEAAKITVPVYLCNGEQDVSPDFHAEPGYYPNCPDISLHLLPSSAHCQNFASTRQQMWQRMHSWAQMVQ